jgi:hypothetical protein
MKTTCPTCGGEHDDSKPCPICASMERMRLAAIEKGFVKEQKSKPAAQPPEGMWWQA